MKVSRIFLAMVLILQMLAVPISAENKNSEIIGSFTFEQGSSPPSATSGNTVASNDEHKNVLSLSGTGASAYFLFDKQVDSGKMVVSYDVLSMQKNKEAYIKMLDGEYTTMWGEAQNHVFEAYIWRSNGNIQMFNNTSWDVNGAPTTPYEPNVWYHIDMWFDFDKRVAEYYVDGAFLGSTPMSENFKAIRGFAHAFSQDGEQWLDNVYAVNFSGGGNNMAEYPFVLAYPESVEHKVSIETKIPNEGHIYFGKEISFTADIKEYINREFNGKLIVSLMGEDGKAVVCEKELKLKPYEEKSLDFNIEALRYGFHNLKVSAINSDGELYGETVTRVSAVAPAGKINPKMAICDHFTKNQGYSKEKALMIKQAGVGSIRDEIRWTDFELNGILGPLTYTKGWMDMMGETEQHMLAILGFYHPDVIDELFPHSFDTMAEFLDYVRAVLEYTKDMNIDYELWNEYNLNNTRYGTSYADYVEMAKAVYPVVKEINPDAKLYVLATGNNATVREYVEECFKLGIGDYCDGVSIHPYNITEAPDTEGALSDVDDIIALMQKYGLSDKELIFSEYGWSSTLKYANEELQANYTIQGAAINQDKVDKIYWYNLQEKTIAGMTDQELHFGFVRGWKDTEIPYEAKPVLLAFSNYNRLMTGSEKIGEIPHSDKNAALHMFKNQNGDNTIIAWSREGNIRTALNLGVDTITLCDRYGNETELATRDGVLDILLTPEPVYIIGGNFENAKEAKSEFVVSQTEVSTVKNDTASIYGRVPAGNWTVEADCPDNIKLSAEPKIAADDSFKIDVTSGTDGIEGEFITVNIKDNTSGRIVYTQRTEVIYSEPIEVTPSVKYYENGHWQLSLKLVNRKNSGNVSGRIVMTQPEGLILSKAESEIKNLLPGEVRYVYINIPLEKSMQELILNGYVETDDGSIIDFTDRSFFVGMMRLENSPVIDGRIDENEYDTIAPARLNKESMIYNLSGNEWTGLNDMSGTVYLNYDKDFFYLAARVKDNAEGATEDSSKIYANDSIQFGFANEALKTAGYTEIGIGKDKDGKPSMHRYSFIGTKFFASNIDETIAFDESCELQIGREGDETIYELKMPWVDIYGEESPEFTRRNVYFCVLINDNDGTGRRGYMQFCEGIGGTKDPSKFMKLPCM